MSPDLERLIKLQHLDSTIDDARRTIAAHPQRLADADARLGEATQAVEAAKQRLKTSQDARRDLEKEAAVYQGRLTKFKEQLSAVKTNREYQAMQHEIEAAQRDLGGVEEKVLERMMESDAVSADVKQAEVALSTQKKLIEAEKKELSEELTTVEALLSRASETRAGLVAQTEKRLIALFEQVAKARKGIAISMATRDGLCEACHVRLRPHVFQQIRQNDSIIQCDSCQRIMYYHPPPPPVEQAVTHRS
jgi:predicted  nucleic acid-binding Zn-ribbon protein